jgi:hypothetical protein
MGEFPAKIKLIENCRTSAVQQSVNTLKVKLSKIEAPFERPMIESSIMSQVEDDIQSIEEMCEVKFHDDFQPFQLIPGSKVRHKEEGIVGEIKFIGSEKVAVVWEDNTRERISFDEARKNLEYIDDIQSIVAPTTSQMSYNPTVNKMLDKAIASLDEDELDEEIIEIGSVEAILTSEKDFDIEKIKMQRTINDLNDQLVEKKTDSMKEKIARELVDVAIMKGIIDRDDLDLEITKVMSFSDSEFENYKTSVLDYETDGSIVTSSFAPIQPEMTEAEKMLARIKNNGGKGIIGDFSKELNVSASSTPQIISNNVSSTAERRTLAEIKDDKFTFAKVNEKIPTFEEQFESILSAKVNDNQRAIEASYIERNYIEEPKELPGFENLQGLKKPLRVTEKATSFPTNTNLKDLFSEMGWTTLSK